MVEEHHIRLPGPVTAPGIYQPELLSSTQQSNLIIPPVNGMNSADEKKKPDVAWKYEGYQEFSEWMASDDDLFVFRRFASINARVILWMQHQIAQKEQQLEVFQKKVIESPCQNGWRNDSFTWDARYLTERDSLMHELSLLMMHYNKYVEAFSKIRSRPSANERQINNVRNWLSDIKGGYRQAIDVQETKSYMDSRYAADLISISLRSRPPLGRWLESFQKLQLSKLFRAELIPGKHKESRTTTYSSDTKFENLTNCSIILGGLIMLLTPLWLLEYYSGSKTRLGIITTFVVVFMFTMSTATINRPFEVVAASAAYAAVLMVFMQINPS